LYNTIGVLIKHLVAVSWSTDGGTLLKRGAKRISVTSDSPAINRWGEGRGASTPFSTSGVPTTRRGWSSQIHPFDLEAFTQFYVFSLEGKKKYSRHHFVTKNIRTLYENTTYSMYVLEILK
jgi:hypothetical protein